MGFYVSPGIYTREKDLSEVITTLGTTSAALVGYSPKGDNTKFVLVTNNQQFIQEYGIPVPGNYFHYTALAFLKNGNTLYCRRATSPFIAINPCYFGGAKIRTQVNKNTNANISFDPSTDKIANLKATVSFGGTDLFYIVGRDPGVWNNKISVKITKVNDENSPVESISLKSSGKISSGNGLDLTKSFALAGFSTIPSGSATFNGIIFTLSSYASVQAFIDAVNANVTANCTLSYNSNTDKFSLISSGSSFVIADSTSSSTSGFFTAAKITANTYSYTKGNNPNVIFDIVVYDNSGGSAVKAETWTVSRNHLLDGFGKQLYLMDKINGYSKYIRVIDNTVIDSFIFPSSQLIALSLAAGTAGDTPQDGDYNIGWDSFANPEEVDIRILINGGLTSPNIQSYMKGIVESRKDCMSIFDMDKGVIDTNDVNAYVDWRNNIQNINSSYCALYAPWTKIYDNYSDKILDIPGSGEAASRWVLNDFVAGPNYAPAGEERGTMDVLGLTKIFTQGERDILAQAQINAFQTVRGKGNIIWDEKTLQSASSDLSFIHVRRLLIVVEKAISAGISRFLYQIDDPITRFNIVATIDSYLSDLSAKRYFQNDQGDKGYRIVCDNTNNTPQLIQQNELHVDIFVKPIHTIRVIQLQSIITQVGASFTELIAQGVMF